MGIRRWDLPLDSIGKEARLIITFTNVGSGVLKPTDEELRFYAALLGLHHAFSTARSTSAGTHAAADGTDTRTDVSETSSGQRERV